MSLFLHPLFSQYIFIATYVDSDKTNKREISLLFEENRRASVKII